MIKNYIKIAIRKAIKDKSYTLINIVGLAIGLASFLFISRYIDFERSVDRFHENYLTIYRLHTDLKWNEVDDVFPQTAPAVGTSIKDNFAEVEYVTRIRPYFREKMIEVGSDVYRESNVLSVDSNFLKVFSFIILQGNRDRMFVEPNQVVLSESMAKKLFGDKMCINETIEIDEKPFIISGIIEDAPINSHIQYSILTSNLSDEELKYFEWSWIWCNLVTYVKLNPNTSPEQLEAKFPELVKNNAGYTIERITGNSIDTFFKNGNKIAYKLEPLSDVYYSGYNSIGTSGSETFVIIFGVVALTILLLACINYTNLTTSRSIKRAKEIGLRKVAGTSKTQLYIQFLFESILFSLMATVLAILLYESLNSLISGIFEIRWNLSLIHKINYLWFVLGISLIVGIISGIYPAVYLSSFNPSRAIKGLQVKGQTKSHFRNVMVVFQFIISFCIIIFTFTVNSQISFLRNRDYGFDRENLLVIDNINQLRNRTAFKQQVISNPAVISATLSSNIPSPSAHNELFRRLNGEKKDFIMTLIDADQDFIKTFGLNLVEGSNFSDKDLFTLNPRVIMNRKAMKIMEYNNAIGEKIMGLDDGRILEVTGLIDDFDYFMSQSELQPIILRPYLDSIPVNEIRHLSVKVASDNLHETIKQLEEVWNNQKSGLAFQYHFYDQIFHNTYQREIQLGNLLSLFSGLAITIAVLGLIGLISFHTEQMTKSIGIRKVFGATVTNILGLITKDFTRLFIIAFVISVPLANYVIEDWLETFVYKININPGLFIVPGIVIITIALFTIWIQSFKSASANPVDAIRNE